MRQPRGETKVGKEPSLSHSVSTGKVTGNGGLSCSSMEFNSKEEIPMDQVPSQPLRAKDTSGPRDYKFKLAAGMVSGAEDRASWVREAMAK